MGEVHRLAVRSSGPEADLEHIARRLREVRLARGFTVDQLGEMIGVAGTYIEAIETGANRPSLPLLCHLAMHLRSPLRDLVP